MTSPVEYRYARAKVKPIAGSPDGVPHTAPVAPVPAAPDLSQAGAPVAGTHALLDPAVQAAAKAEADRAALAAEEAAKAPAAPTEPTGTAELPQAGEVPTAAPASNTEASEVSAEVLEFLKNHPDAEKLIESLAHKEA